DRVVMTVKSPITMNAVKNGVMGNDGREVVSGKYKATVIPSPTDPVSQKNPDRFLDRLWLSLDGYSQEEDLVIGRPWISLNNERGVSIRKTTR
ncbi:MAG: hypothetical protein AAB791_02275, partial [Patescibacteria group bacterium]